MTGTALPRYVQHKYSISITKTSDRDTAHTSSKKNNLPLFPLSESPPRHIFTKYRTYSTRGCNLRKHVIRLTHEQKCIRYSVPDSVPEGTPYFCLGSLTTLLSFNQSYTTVNESSRGNCSDMFLPLTRTVQLSYMPPRSLLPLSLLNPQCGMV